MRVKSKGKTLVRDSVFLSDRSKKLIDNGAGVRKWLSIQNELDEDEVKLIHQLSYFCDFKGSFHLSIFDIKFVLRWEMKEIRRVLLSLREKRALLFWFNWPEKYSISTLQMVRLFKCKIRNRLLKSV